MNIRSKLILFALGAMLIGVLAAPSHAQSRQGYPRVMQGPMLGAVTPQSVMVWIRGSGEFRYAIEYATAHDFRDATRSREQVARKSEDYTLVFKLGGLEPDTRYYYRVIAERRVSKYERETIPMYFTTPPEGAHPFRVSFGSCARYQKTARQPIWGPIEDLEPDLFFWLGDNIYGDALDPDILAEEYRRQRDIPEIFPVIRSVPQLATWDDHDFGLNNHDRTNPIKRDALRVFQQYWPNPSFGLEDAPGVFFAYRYGGVDFFFLDGRYHRDPNAAPDRPGKTMLGEAQYDWLIEGLASSDAPFKIIVSGSGFTSVKGPEGDAWSAFLSERNRLFRDIAERGIGGVLLFSGDTHMGELNRIESPHPGGYPLFELVSSPLAQEPNTARRDLHGDESRIRPYYSQASNAALVDIDPTLDDPTITLTLVNEFGEIVWDPFTIRASELRVR